MTGSSSDLARRWLIEHRRPFVVAIHLALVAGRRIAREITQVKRPGQLKQLLIFGAGDAGEMIVRDMKKNPSYNYEPIGFLDDDQAKVGRRIHGVAVLGTRKDLPWILNTHGVDEILIAIPNGVRPLPRDPLWNTKCQFRKRQDCRIEKL
jgi:FlaA1/EpsC-like NDP-sugar epimerase